MNSNNNGKTLLDNARGKKTIKKPIWLMRQAGRYLPEYMEVRKNFNSFLDLCYDTENAFKITCQPIDRFDMDGVIIFSDILVAIDAMGLAVTFNENGPSINPITNEKDLVRLSFDNFEEKIEPIAKLMNKLGNHFANSNKTVIGFCGAPWTLACYLTSGQRDKDNFFQTKRLIHTNPDLFDEIVEILTQAVIKLALTQIKNGAEVMQIFDSWSSILTSEEFVKYTILPTKKIIQSIRQYYPNVPIIGFPRGCGMNYLNYIEGVNVDVLSIDESIDIVRFHEKIILPTKSSLVLQGNLDPTSLIYDRQKSLQYANKILQYFQDQPFIMNLGHGINKLTPIDHVASIVNFVHEYH